MSDTYKGGERREFFRYDYTKPLTYFKLTEGDNKSLASKVVTAISKNLSATGILFTANPERIPGISNIVAMDIDYQAANVCREIEERVLILKDKLIGKVVRIDDNEDGTCGVGVAFVKKSDNLAEEIRNIETLIK